MLQREHSALLSPFIKLPFVIKTFVMSIFEWPFYTGFTVYCCKKCFNEQKRNAHPPIHLLHSINQYCVMKKRDLFPMNEMDLKFNKICIFFVFSIDSFRILEILFDRL